MMALLQSILILISLNAIVEANKVTFTKVYERIYVETDAQHYAMWGQVRDGDGVRIVAVNGVTRYQQSMRCATDQQRLTEVDKEILEAYGKVRTNFLKVVKSRFNELRGRISWSADISDDQNEYSATKVGRDIYAYSSKYFPSKISKVIIDSDVVIFVHRDGFVAMKTIDCLFKNEKILVKGISKINRGDNLIPRMTPVGDETLEKYLKRHPINESELYKEQEYIKTKEEKYSLKRKLLPKVLYDPHIII